MTLVKKKNLIISLVFLVLIALLYASSGMILTSIGEFLIVDEEPTKSGAAVVLNTGVEYYPRLIEAADLYNRGLVKKVVINGNRKTDALRDLEEKGLKHCCPWYEGRLRILELFDVPRKDVIIISAEDVYDTISEAKEVGSKVIGEKISKIVIVTSKSHTRRARYIWNKIWHKRFRIEVVAAQGDPFSTRKWWTEGRQIRWVLSEYGAFLFMVIRDFKV